jgi:hypothetical protein
MQHEIHFCVQWNYEKVMGPVKQQTGVRQGCSLGPSLFNIFTNGNVANIHDKMPHIQAVDKQVILALLPTDDLANRSVPTNSLLKGMIIQ